MPRPWSEKHVLVAYSGAGLVVGVLLSIALVWNFVDRYAIRPDGSLNTYPSRPYQNRMVDPGQFELVDHVDGRRLTPSEKVWVFCQESAVIWFVTGLFGFGVGMIHLRVRCRLRNRARDPERQHYDDSVGRLPPPAAA